MITVRRIALIALLSVVHQITTLITVLRRMPLTTMVVPPILIHKPLNEGLRKTNTTTLGGEPSLCSPTHCTGEETTSTVMTMPLTWNRANVRNMFHQYLPLSSFMTCSGQIVDQPSVPLRTQTLVYPARLSWPHSSMYCSDVRSLPSSFLGTEVMA